ncbi:molecular chaperone TorD family protein [Aromatoleum toluclasticum]|uniref:molecular chaperone TorD family protein n=1 Tax=Aromatoleum toluclasticum TaxID=92003 RepID=UPI000367315F|nr:molecular chaperone TorD family protein [Aromatoleum toluclasticum]
MSARDEFTDFSRSAIGRSAMYAALSRAFTYEGAGSGPMAIVGSDFNTAFDPSVSEQACSLREGAYAGGDQSALFEELMRFYGFFGLGRDERAEMPDHLSVELEFMHFLTHQQECSAGQPEARESLLRAQRDFLSRHLLRLVSGVRSALKSGSSACRDLIELTAAFVDEDLQELSRRQTS